MLVLKEFSKEHTRRATRAAFVPDLRFPIIVQSSFCGGVEYVGRRLELEGGGQGGCKEEVGGEVKCMCQKVCRRRCRRRFVEELSKRRSDVEEKKGCRRSKGVSLVICCDNECLICVSSRHLP